MPAPAQQITRGSFGIDADAVLLRNVAQAPPAPRGNGERLVYTP